MRLDRILAVLVSAAVAAVVATAVSAAGARAEGEADAGARLVPYRGTLELDGRPFTGRLDAEFRLYDGPEAETPLWTETHRATDGHAVAVNGGRFTATLGATGADSALALGDALASGGERYLAVSLLVGAARVDLAHRQRLLTAPFALSFGDIAGDLWVGGSLATGGDLAVDGALRVTGELRLGWSEPYCCGSAWEGNCWGGTTCAAGAPGIVQMTCPGGTTALRGGAYCLEAVFDQDGQHYDYRGVLQRRQPTTDLGGWEATCVQFDGSASVGHPPLDGMAVGCTRIR